MKLLIVAALLVIFGGKPLSANVFVVFYITADGTTGHAGIAVENYTFQVGEKLINGQLCRQVDTVSKGTLTFFDLWPEADIPYGKFNRNTTPRYNRFPRSSAEREITVESLLDRGLPRGCRYPCDALLRIPSTAREDLALVQYIDSLTTQRPFYNARRYNCVDFVRLCLEHACGMRVHAKEFVPMSWISTPNRFFRALVGNKTRAVEVLRDPGPGVRRSFFAERVLKRKKERRN